MAFVRVIERGQRAYYYLVESIREGKKVRQKNLRYLGTSKPSEAEIRRIISEIKGVKKP